MSGTQDLRGLPQDVPASVWVALAVCVRGTEVGARFVYHDDLDHFGVEMPGGETWIVTHEDYDELERRGWLDATGESVAATERGRWWYGRWAKRNWILGAG